MITEMYIITFLLTILLFFIGASNVFNMDKGPRMLCMIMAFIMNLVVLFGGFSIDTTNCELVNVTLNYWLCNTNSVQELPLVGFSLFMLIMILVYLILEYMGKLDEV